MKVIHIIATLHVGGAEKVLMRLIENSNQDHKVISLTEIGVVGKQMQSLGIGVSALGMRMSLKSIWHFMQLIFLIKREQPDVVQTWLYHADFVGGLAARLAGVKSVVWGVHSTSLVAGVSVFTRLVRRLCVVLSYLVPRAIVCVAKSAKQVHADLGYCRRRLHFIPNGFDIAELQSLAGERSKIRDALGFNDNDIVIGSVGRFNEDKDPGNFIQAAKKLSAKVSNVKFLMIGRGICWENNKLKNMLAHAAVKDRFTLMGELDNVSSYLGGMDIFCLHSKTEAFPLVVGEAMAMALPSVVTDVGDAATMIGASGLSVKKGDSTSLAKGLEALASMHPDRRLSMGLKGKERLATKYTIAAMITSYDVLYRNVANNGDL